MTQAVSATQQSLPPRSSNRWVPVTTARVLVWLAVLSGTGLAIGGPLSNVVGDEDAVVAALEDARTSTWNQVSHVWSTLADTEVIIATALVVGLVMRLVYRRWLEPLLVWGAVALQSTVFLTTTVLVERQRPDVERLDAAPPTSSFPSGHTCASTALYLSIGLVLAAHVRSRAGRVLVVAVLLVVPLGVAAARVYRGMHFPTDVVFGGLNGVVAVLVVRSALLGWREHPVPDASVRR